jgi:hypothetical protein
VQVTGGLAELERVAWCITESTHCLLNEFGRLQGKG